MKNLFLVLLASLSLLSFSACAEETRDSEGFEAGAKDAWIMGKIETLYTLNKHLSPFAIHTAVENGTVRLSGAVESNIDRDLAGELAKGVKGVVGVNNELTIETTDARKARANESKDDGDRSFSQWVEDATTTAVVKSKLLADSNTKGLKINVDTKNDVVTLSGRVATSESKQLAEQIARNTGDVETVRNQLTIGPATK